MIHPWKLHNIDALKYLETLESGSVDAVVTDPPYSSGGMMRGDRASTTNEKYSNSEQRGNYANFTGDNRDQRGWAYWCALWLSECLRVTAPGGVIAMFADWRQLPAATDVLQAGGWVWRGIVPWNKTEAARPQKGRFRQQCEYVVWGTAGPMVEQTDLCLPGFFTYVVNASEKHHQTGKPIPLMVDILEVTRPGGVILDPFAGSGSTGVACAITGRRFIGSEKDDHYYKVAERLIGDAYLQKGLFHLPAQKPEAPTQRAMTI